MKLVVFEDDELAGFGPLTTLRHASQMRWGTMTLLKAALQELPESADLFLWGRAELGEVTKEEVGGGYNETVSGQALFVNARAKPNRSLRSLLARKGRYAAFSKGRLVAASLDGSLFSPGVLKRKEIAKATKGDGKVELPPESVFEGYWDLVESNALAIADQAKHFEDPLSVPSSVEIRGPPSNLRVDGGAEVEGHVTFDTRLGPVVVESGASIESFSRVMGPCYIGPKTKVYSAKIGGGTSVFEGCKLGGQVENSIIMPHTNKAHEGYVGDSYVGEWVNLGAGSNFSNLKNTYGNVRLEIGERKIDSGMLKLGPVVGDLAKLSIGALVYAGRQVGTGSQVAGLVSRNIPSFTFLGLGGKMVELHLDSVVETQRRMMERRGRTLTRAGEALIRLVFRSTSGERKKGGARKGSLT